MTSFIFIVSILLLGALFAALCSFVVMAVAFIWQCLNPEEPTDAFQPAPSGTGENKTPKDNYNE